MVMRVLITTQPGVGHLHPLLPVAAGLRARGHHAAFASSASFAAEIVAAGFEAFAVGRDWLAVGMVRAFPEVASKPPGPERYAWARSAIFAGQTARDSGPDLVALSDTWRPDLIVRARPPSTAGAWPPSSSTCRTPSCGPIPGARPTANDTSSPTLWPSCGRGSVYRPILTSRCRSAICSCRSRRSDWTNPTTRGRPPVTASGRTHSGRPRSGGAGLARRSAATGDGVRHARHGLQRDRPADGHRRRPRARGPQPRRDRRRDTGPTVGTARCPPR